jgi:predicted metalloprotease with PDZ domain
MYKPLCVAAAMLAAQSAFAFDQQTNHYRLRIDQDAKRAHVEADVWVEGRELALFNVMPIPQLKNGQADLIEKLAVRDMNGNAVALKDKGEGEYEVDGDRRLRLSYDIRLEHDKYQWPGGNEEVSYHTDEGLMSVGYPLFIVPGVKMHGQTEVSFDLPTGWKANTPWRSAGKPGVFIAETRRELVNNALFFGTARSETFKAGGVEMTLVMGKQYWKRRDAFISMIDKQMNSYQKLYGRGPVADRFLIVINQGDSGDGGAFAGSFSQYLKDDGSEVARPIWGKVMAHELAHFWDGHSLVPKHESEEWFKEGVNDYVTVITMARNKLIDRTMLIQQLENLARGQNVARNVQGLTMTVREAVQDKHRNWLLVYGGGTIAGLAMDVELRKATGGKVGLDHLLKEMYKEFGHKGKTYDQADIVRIGKAVGGIDLDPLLNRIVASSKAPELGPLFKEIGLRLEQFGMLETYLLRDPAATAEQKARFTAIFGQPY